MYLFHLLRSFLPLHNPIGFGAADFIELVFCSALVALALGRRWVMDAGARLARRTGWSMLALGALSIALRLALLAHVPVPTPAGSDDFSYLLAADTISHARLANPMHPLREFFESIFVLQEPTYSSIFPLGQALALAAGKVIFGTPWAGVLLSVAALCALCYWMLLAWTTPGWAMVGGLLAVCEFGVLSSWTNSYWGGAVSGVAGALVFGAAPRLIERPRLRYAVLLGLGLGLQLLARPYESILLLLSVLLFAFMSRSQWDTGLMQVTALAALVALPAVALTLVQNKRVTGSWTTLPYMLSRYQYGIPATFTVQPNPVPHRTLTAEQQLDYEAQTAKHGAGPETVRSFLDRFVSRARFYRFFFLAPLYLALPFFLPALRERRLVWVMASLLIFSLGANFYPYFYPHYIAAATCLLLLAAVTGLERLSRLNQGPQVVCLILSLCAAHFLFWYGLYAIGDEQILAAVRSYESWDVVNFGDPEGRIAVNRVVAAAPGKQVVFVRYWPRHMFHEWIHNDADIDGSRVVWAGDRGEAENEKLLRYYPDRAAWLVEPDARPPKLTRYRVEPATVPHTPAPTPVPVPPPPSGASPKLQFEPIPEGK